MPKPRNLALVALLGLAIFLIGSVLGLSIRRPCPECLPASASPAIEAAKADPEVPVAPIVGDAAKPREIPTPVAP